MTERKKTPHLKRCNDLSGKEWLQNSFSIWRGLSKTKEEKNLKHPASFPEALASKIIQSFARKDSNVLDPFSGIGSTMLAAMKTGNKGIGIDLNEEFCKIAETRIQPLPLFKKKENEPLPVQIICGDSLKVLKTIQDSTFDICVTSPPYWDILNRKRTADKKANQNYSDHSDDIGNIKNYDEFLDSCEDIFREVFRTLKSRRTCIINVQDIRKGPTFFPLHSDIAERMKKIGFVYDDLIIWDRQSDYNNMKTLGFPYRFRINKVHEFLMIFWKE